MKKKTRKYLGKILCLVLCLCFTLPIFTVFGFAVSNDRFVYPELPEGYWDDYGVYYRYEAELCGFDKWIDIQEYIDNKGNPGYDELMIVGVDIENSNFEFNSNEFSDGTVTSDFKVYLYNPDFLDFSVLYETDSSGSITYTVDGEEKESPFRWRCIDPDEDSHYLSWKIYDELFIAVKMEGVEFQVESLGDTPTIKFTHIEGNKSFDNEFDVPQGRFFESCPAPDPYVIYRDFEGVCSDVYCEFTLGYNFEGNCSYDPSKSSAVEDLIYFFSEGEENKITEEDLKKMYPVTSGKRVTDIIFFYEDFSRKRLYLYLYDSSGAGFNESMSEAVGITLNNTTYTRRITGDMSQSQGAIYKFYVEDSKGVIGNRSELYERVYKIVDPMYYLAGTSVNPLMVDCEATYTYNSNSVSTFADGGSTNKVVNVKGETVSIRTASTGNSFYSLNNSVNGEYKKQTLRTFYCGLPEYTFLLDDMDPVNDRCLENINVSYYWAEVLPLVITSNKSALYNDLKNFFDTGSWDNSPYEVPVKALATQVRFQNIFEYYPYLLVGNEGLDWLYTFPEHIYNDFLSVVYHSDLDSSFVVANENFETYINEYIKKKGKNPWDKLNYEDIVITKDEFKTLISQKEWSFGESWEKIGLLQTIINKMGGENSLDDTISNISSFVMLKEDDIKIALAMNDDLFCKNYYVNNSAEVKAAMQDCLDNNEVFVMIRYDVYDLYECDDVSYFGNAWMNTDEVVVFQDRYYKDFDILSYTAKNNLETVLYFVDMESQSFGGGGFSGVINPPSLGDAVSGAVGNAKENVKGFWEKILEFFNKLKIVISICVIVFVVIITLPFTIPFFKWLIGGIVKGFKAMIEFFKNIFKRE